MVHFTPVNPCFPGPLTGQFSCISVEDQSLLDLHLIQHQGVVSVGICTGMLGDEIIINTGLKWSTRFKVIQSPI